MGTTRNARYVLGDTTGSGPTITPGTRMPYAYEQLVAWYEEVGGQLPQGASSFGVDGDAGILFLVLHPEHDGAAVQSFLERLPADAVTVRTSDESWRGYGP